MTDSNCMNKIFAKKNIGTKKSLGTLLKNARKKKGITLEKAEIDTKVRLKYLEALEADDYDKMPPDVYNIGFLKRYCEYLGLNSHKYLQYYSEERKLHNEMSKRFFGSKKKIINPGNPEKFKNKIKFVITPQMIISTMVVFLVIGILGYIWFQVKSFAAAPPLKVDNPNEQIMVSMNNVEIKGNTDPTVELTINGRSVGVNENGYFTQNVELINGINTVEIKALNKANKETTKNIKVLVVSSDENIEN